jgi:hypothetical protein
MIIEELQITATAQRILASMPTSSDVVGLHAWAYEKGMPESCGEQLLFLCMAVMRASVQGVDNKAILNHVSCVLETLVVQGDITAHLEVERHPGWEAMAFADFAITFLIERGCPSSLVFDFVERFLVLMQTPTIPC